VWLILCSSTDLPALWAYEGLQKLGLEPLELVFAEHLAFARFWEHRVSAAGATAKIVLPDGRTICTSRVRGALNRLLAPPQDLIQTAAPSDRDYAAGEMMAFYLSWLYGLPGAVINRPTPQGLCGAWRHSSEWVWLAGRAGLPAPPYRQTGRGNIDGGYCSLVPAGERVIKLVVLRSEVFGPTLPDEVAGACRKLAKSAGTEMLGVDVYCGTDSQWTFAGATPSPDFTIGGPPLLEHMAQILRDGGRQ
jgi:hypothetical protein